VLQSDGKIIAAGEAGERNFGLARYNASGSLDTSFGTGGKVTTAFSGGLAAATTVALQTDGKIVAAGYAHASTGYTYDFALARYQANGSLDTSFGTKGKVQTEFSGSGSDDHAYGMAIQGNGKIVAAGTYGPYSSPTLADFALARYTTSGGLDGTFGTGGKVTTDYLGPTPTRGQGMAHQSDGKIVVAGDVNSSWFSLCRYNGDNGSLDTGFGSDGEAMVEIGFDIDDSASGVAVQADNKIVVVGTMIPSDGVADFALVRFTADGSLDTTFGTGGKVTTDFSRRIDHAQAVAIQSDGKIVVAGFSYTSAITDFKFALARYKADGSLDTSFGSRGKVLTSVGSGGAEAYGVAIQSDGKIVVVGRASVSVSLDFALARYMPNGGLDTGFGSGGTVTTDFASSNNYDRAFAVAFQDEAIPGDRKIVAAGFTGTFTGTGTTYDFALARYTDSGGLDPSFGSGGKVTTDFAGNSVVPYGIGVAIQGDGKIVAAGGGGLGFALARYNSDGGLDTGFGSGGTVTTDFTGNGDQAFAVAIQSDGKIVAAGYARGGTSTIDDFALARYLGSPTAPQPLGGAVTASTGSMNPMVAYWATGQGSTSGNPDAIGAFPQGPLAVMPDTASWVTVFPYATRQRHSKGVPSLWLTTLDSDGLPVAERES
jgi:uncharacterized delta-60 repeat protein